MAKISSEIGQVKSEINKLLEKKHKNNDYGTYNIIDERNKNKTFKL